MDHFDKLIPLAILAIIAVLLGALARRAARSERALASAPPEPTPASVPASVPPAMPAAPIVVVEEMTPRRRKAIVLPSPAPPTPTVIDDVLHMLKDKDSLATAFLLREILDKPKSMRRR